ncbi:flagellar biosynthesis protein FlhF [Ramlibacter sp. MAHUQ-53]|uniref:flagellar biosynthesis protein FlhF n=1 Tax=unclassified Ramlibacter TaxID=2617605 RepID=UPI00363F89EC
MNVKRFVGKNAREAMAQVRAAWGDEAVVLSNRPIPGGVEILALPASAEIPAAPPRREARAAAAPAAAGSAPVEPMSTVSFERFVRERQRQQLAQEAASAPSPADAGTDAPLAVSAGRVPPSEPARFAAGELREALGEQGLADARLGMPAALPSPAAARAAAYAETRDRSADASELMMSELRAMRGMIASQLASLSWFDSVRRSPAQTQSLRHLISNGFSPALARHLVSRLPEGLDEARAGQWLSQVLAKNLRCTPEEESIAARGGVFALVGPTGVGKTTTTAKLAANFAMRHGAASVGLITVDTYRMAASDQLRAFGRILGIPVHTARDAASLQDLLALFDRKQLVLVDTVGLGQRDERMKELFDALPADRVQRLLVLNAGAQAETLDEVVRAYGGEPGTRCVFSKLDEAVKCGAVLDVAIRRKLRVEGVANGQRVPEDWQPADAARLVEQALARQPDSLFTPDDTELGLLLTAPPMAPSGPWSADSAQARHA